MKLLWKTLVGLLLIGFLFVFFFVRFNFVDPDYFVEGTYRSGSSGESMTMTKSLDTLAEVVFPRCPEYMGTNFGDLDLQGILLFHLDKGTCRLELGWG
jgi:hypothetical protein